MRSIVLHFPLVSQRGEAARWTGDRLGVGKERAYVELEADGPPESREVGRVFNFVPGLEAIPVRFILPQDGRLRLRLTAGPPPAPSAQESCPAL